MSDHVSDLPRIRMDHNIACRLSSQIIVTSHRSLAPSRLRAVSPVRERAATLGCRSRASPGVGSLRATRIFLCPGTRPAPGERCPCPPREGRVAGRGGVARAGRASIVTHIDILRGAVSKGRAKFPPNLPNLREPASDQNYLAWASSKVSPCPRDRRASPSAPSFASRCFLRGSHVCW